MNDRERHPVWIRPTSAQLSSIVGGCLVSPVKNIDVTVEKDMLADPTLEIYLKCKKYPSDIISVPFPLMDAADTNQEQTQLGVDSAQFALSSLCENCEHRVTLE